MVGACAQRRRQPRRCTKRGEEVSERVWRAQVTTRLGVPSLGLSLTGLVHAGLLSLPGCNCSPAVKPLASWGATTALPRQSIGIKWLARSSISSFTVIYSSLSYRIAGKRWLSVYNSFTRFSESPRYTASTGAGDFISP